MLTRFLSLVKFSHTIFALPFALIGFFLAIAYAGYDFEWSTFVLVLFCMLFARNAAMAFNRYVDRHIDRKNPRTAARELPSGLISEKAVLGFVFLNAAFFMCCAYLINVLCFALSPIALFIILGYSYTKRFTYLSHFILGLGLSLAPMGAWLAVTAYFDWLPLLFSFAVLCWVSGFDIIYALQDEAFDKTYHLFSIPASFGKRYALVLSSILHFLTSVFIITAGIYADFGVWYWAGTIIFLSLLVYQHLLVKPEDLSRINIAFFTTNGIASVIFAGFVLMDLFTRR